MNRVIRRAASFVLLTCIAATVFALPAFAASKHAISGTCRADAQWYISELDRKVPASNTTIRASFHNLCAKNMYFKLVNATTGGQFGSTIVANGDAQTLATGVKAGTLFNNAFRLASEVGIFQDRKFAGYQWY